MYPGRFGQFKGKDYKPGVQQGIITVSASSTITDDTKYNAWPVICRMANGDLVLGYTKADSHHADNTGNAVGKISGDDGATWGGEFTIYDHATLWASVYGLTAISTGRLIATLWRDNVSVSGSGEAGLVYSDNNGSTWSAWVSLTSAFSQESYSAGPVVELANGDLLVTIEGTDSGAVANRSCRTLKSTDHGATWGSVVTVAAYSGGTRPYYESKLILLPTGRLLCLHRTSGGTGTCYSNYSDDSGATWSTPVSAFAGYGAPSSVILTNPTIVVGNRRNSDAACIVYASTDLGATWGTAVVVDATMFEMEYACPVQMTDKRVLLVYGSQPSSSITNADIKSVILS